MPRRGVHPADTTDHPNLNVVPYDDDGKHADDGCDESRETVDFFDGTAGGDAQFDFLWIPDR